MCSYSTEFTDNAWDAMYDAVDSTFFKDKEADSIYNFLRIKLRFVSFGDYLKRYIYRNAGLDKPFTDVTIKEYQEVIKYSFSDNHTPCSFEPTTAKLSALSKNWLTQQTVRRKVVFLLGFGLSMSVEDVNEFLKKGLREHGINAKDPFEVICWYCYKNHYGYLKFESLWETFCSMPIDKSFEQFGFSELTVGSRDTIKNIHSESALLSFVSKLKTPNDRPKLSVTARKCFDELFDQAKAVVARMYNEEEERLHEEEVSQYISRLMSNERISDEELRVRIAKKKEQRKIYTAEEITESDLENIISSAIPKDRHGNLTPSKASKLNAQFAGKRFSRQHISDILSGKAEVTRFDLITLNFFIYSQEDKLSSNVKKRYSEFYDSTNKILKKCYLGELYISNPYECFVQMCILTQDPLGTYADVWEMSYE